MTVLECEKCHNAGANDFTQLDPVTRGLELIQRFKCNKCGHIKEVSSVCSGIALTSLREDYSRDLWSGMRVWYPAGDPNGRYYRTEYAGKTEKDGEVTVHMKLIPEREREE